jgi:hypothetical protein
MKLENVFHCIPWNLEGTFHIFFSKTFSSFTIFRLYLLFGIYLQILFYGGSRMHGNLENFLLDVENPNLVEL